MGEPLMVPRLSTVQALRQVTEDTVLLELAPDGAPGRAYVPGQFMELSVLGVGECPISITSTPTRPARVEFAVRDVGTVTHALHNLEPGDQLGLRGPFGNGFPTEELTGRDLYFVAGGIGLVKGVNTVSARTLRNILSGWFLTPIVSCIFSVAIYFVSQLQFEPPAG